MIWILPLTVFLYLVFVGFIVWRSHNLCDLGIFLLSASGVTICAMATGLTVHLSPEDPNNWKAVCVRSHGSIKQVELERKSQPNQIYETCDLSNPEK